MGEEHWSDALGGYRPGSSEENDFAGRWEIVVSPETDLALNP